MPLAIKTSVTLKRNGNGLYKVVSLSNRLVPTVGTNLQVFEVEALINEATVSLGQMSVNIKA